MTRKKNDVENHFKDVDNKIKSSYEVARAARKKGYDPEDDVGIPLVKDMAERVEGLIGVIAPQIKGSGVSDRIKKLEEKYGALDWRIALTIALEVAQGKFCKFKDKKESMEIGIRTGFAYITMGVVASPLEGLVSIRFQNRKDGKEYFELRYAGPIRSAGGTGESVSVLIADYVRKKMGYEIYDPQPEEIKRNVTELYDYHERITNLQYLPSPEEIEFLSKHLPVQISGEPSEKIDVSNYKDLPRVDTNKIRNGLCLVMGEGIAQKAPKLWKQLSKWGKDFDLEHWNFLEQFIELQKKIKAKGKAETKSEEKISPDFTFIKDIVAGRPVFTHPLRAGGFRLRYGRSRTSGYSSTSVNPATMFVLNQYMATGTQLKVERPGKAASITACDTIEGPIVKLKEGSVVKINSLNKAKEHFSQVSEVLFLGDMLINYGDFFNRAHKLVPPGYCAEWWVQELEKETVNMFGSLDVSKLSDMTEIPDKVISNILQKPLETKISAKDAISFSRKLGIPLHPDFTYFWKTITKEQLISLLQWLGNMKIIQDEKSINKVVLPIAEAKRVMELLGIPHIVVNNEYVVLNSDDSAALVECLDLNNRAISDVLFEAEKAETKEVLDIINKISGIKIRDKAGIFIGARMGRPEKAKMRKLTGSPQVLFPVGEEGGRFRCFQSALEAGKVRSSFPIFQCTKCDKETIYPSCEACGRKTKRMYYCRQCGNTVPDQECQVANKDGHIHGKAFPYREIELDICHYFTSCINKLDMKTYPDLIKGVKGTSNKDHTPEQLIKGILRAKHDIYVNKDGTTRYDMTQLPITHFKPKEIGTSIERLKELGYLYDIKGNELADPDQVLEIFPQDIILPACDKSPEEGADKVLHRISNFVDELLEKFYEIKPFYNLNSESDLAGQIVLCLAPHTSAAIAARIIGFSKTQGFLAHPMIHAATRRDCDGDEACVVLLMDALLNFSRHYLPAHRGSTQDAPLVITSRLILTEVDDMIFDVDTAWKYPLEFYEACLEYKNPWDVKIENVGMRLGTEGEYQGYGFTHGTGDINHTVRCSAYKTLPSMEEKLKGQMDIAEKVRAVDTSDVARLVIEKHFLKDTKGNLRKFSMQQFRCVNCNEKFRRPPLIGKCTSCGGKIIFTISEGSVIKYLGPAISLANKYDLRPYLKQTLHLLQSRVDEVFGKEKEKQEGLGKWFG